MRAGRYLLPDKSGYLQSLTDVWRHVNGLPTAASKLVGPLVDSLTAMPSDFKLPPGWRVLNRPQLGGPGVKRY